MFLQSVRQAGKQERRRQDEREKKGGREQCEEEEASQQHISIVQCDWQLVKMRSSGTVECVITIGRTLS
jgi:hypothetical protein